MKNLKKITFLAFFIMFLFASQALCNESNTNQNVLSAQDEKSQEELTGLIRNAIEDNNWLYAKTKKELKENLSLYYTEPLLQEISENAWQFIEQHTDWYSEASLKETKILNLSESRVVIMAYLLDKDITTGEEQAGKCVYTLIQTNAGWRIALAHYQWGKRDMAKVNFF